MKISVYTLGCRLNQLESEAIEDAFIKEGWESAGGGRADDDAAQDDAASGEGAGFDADLYIVNSCTVTGKADQKCRRMIRKFALTGRPVIVTGCYSALDGDFINSLGENVIATGVREKDALLSLPSALEIDGPIDGEAIRKHIQTSVSGDPFAFSPSRFEKHSRAYLKVEDGCDNHCSYCRTRIARGPAISLERKEAVRRALGLYNSGYREICLTGVNLTMYGRSDGGLGALLEDLIEALPDDARLRFSSMESDGIDERLLDAIKSPKVRPHFHLPIQSASDKVLRRVKRADSKAHLLYVIERLRSAKDNPFLAADIITGLPGEGDAEFEETYELIKNSGFAAAHVFPFSPRPGTELAAAKDRVPEYIRDERALRLRKLAAELHEQYIKSWVGRSVEAIVERGGGEFVATTENYLKVKLSGNTEGLFCGAPVRVRIKEKKEGEVLIPAEII